MNTGAPEGERVPASYKTIAVLLIYVTTRTPPKQGMNTGAPEG
jgi:hypothetical protein